MWKGYTTIVSLKVNGREFPKLTVSLCSKQEKETDPSWWSWRNKVLEPLLWKTSSTFSSCFENLSFPISSLSESLQPAIVVSAKSNFPYQV